MSAVLGHDAFETSPLMTIVAPHHRPTKSALANFLACGLLRPRQW
ncbi:MAG TPA: hypothetical protein PKL73_25595 [Polyangiaceae bacterium]|nr:hypothetical protein [Polyangiaceae bacterium]HNZ22403.1 hypothetical protein [Polyangiaceae bacterium]HOD20938.1 hypothetical protein [Polyangiaceae bacterium]HOE48296.1 hypothetical protein [Polyangiaceae bacterium]HOH00072.1 hypothetical protein [Polyangiaceae bacterium]